MTATCLLRSVLVLLLAFTLAAQPPATPLAAGPRGRASVPRAFVALDGLLKAQFQSLPGEQESSESPQRDPPKGTEQVPVPRPSPPPLNPPPPRIKKHCAPVVVAALGIAAAAIGGGTYFIVTSKQTISPGPPPIQERSIPRLLGGVGLIVGSIPLALVPVMIAGCD
jgi:hypothetical protein